MILAVLLLAGCSADPDRPGHPSAGPGPTWTVAVWMDADNDIEPMVFHDLNEFERAATDDIRIVVQADRIPGFDDSHDDWTGGRRYEIVPDQSEDFVSPLLADLGEVDMGSAAELSDFLGFVGDEYPAERTALVMWDHGGGYWIALDETSGNRINITKGELDDALRGFVSEHGKLDLIGFDACNMGQWETAYSLTDEVRVFVGSQAWVNFPGYAYDVAFQGLPKGATAAEMGDALARSAIDPNHGHTHAAVDLEQLGPLSDAIDRLGDAYLAMPGGVDAFVDVREAARGLDHEWDEYWMDLGDFADGGTALGDPAVAAASSDVRVALDDAIIGRYAKDSLSWASGLTIFTDTSTGYWVTRYEDGPWAVTAWDDLLQTAYSAGK